MRRFQYVDFIYNSCCILDIDNDNCEYFEFFVNSLIDNKVSKDIWYNFLNRYFVDYMLDCEKYIVKYSIHFFRVLYEKNLFIYIEDRFSKNLELIFRYALQLNYPNIIDYFIINEIYLNDINDSMIIRFSDILLEIIQNDCIESFIYAINNMEIDNNVIYETIKKCGYFLTKDYIKIMYENNVLNSKSIKFLKKYTKNNPNKNVRKYVKLL